MHRIFAFVGMSVGGWLGWTVGAWMSLFTAFIVSVVGMGLGLYAVQRVTRHLLP